VLPAADEVKAVAWQEDVVQFPRRPRVDLLELLASADVAVEWQDGKKSGGLADGTRGLGTTVPAVPEMAQIPDKATTGIEPV
jgi:hypothetical protein